MQEPRPQALAAVGSPRSSPWAKRLLPPAVGLTKASGEFLVGPSAGEAASSHYTNRKPALSLPSGVHETQETFPADGCAEQESA